MKGTRTNQTLAAAGSGIEIETDQIPEPRYRAGRPVGQDGEDEKLGELLESGSFRGSDDPGRVFERTETDDRAGQANTT